MLFNEKKTFIIAEAGVNHNGDLNIAKKLVDVAVSAGADAVKFQTFQKAENVISKTAPKAEYQKKTTGNHENQLTMVRKLLLPFGEFIELKTYCDKKKFFSINSI